MNRAEILAACKNSKEFFFESFYKIPDIVNGGLTYFTLRDFQKDIIRDIENNSNIIGLKARQIGWTTIAVANALHDVLFNEWRPWTFISRNEKAAQDMVTKATIAYFRLPPWMREALPKLSSETQGSLHFANGSRIDAEPATGSSFRGDAVWGLLMDECAFMDYAEDIWGAVEAGVKGPKMLFSTANGMGNFFHDIWLDAQREGTVWHSIFYPWNTDESRDKDWYDLKKLSYRGREWLFYQEYPSSPEEAFAKSGRVAFPTDILMECFEEIDPALKLQWIIGGEPQVIDVLDDVDIPLNIWREPEVVRDDTERPKWLPNYVIGADVAEGLEHGDFTYVSVFDVNTHEQVASSKSAIPVSYLDEMLNWLGEYYMTGLIIVERNNSGILPIDRLWRDHWYPRLYRMERFAEIPFNDRTARYGWVTSKQSKPKMVLDFFHALSLGDVILHDPEFIYQAQTFVADGKGSYAGTEGNHDDVIMGTLVAWQGLLDSHRFEVVWHDSKHLPPTHDEVDAIIYASKELNNADFLEQPIGQEPYVKPKKSVGFTQANFVNTKTSSN